MTMIIVAGVCSLIIPLYVVLLMTDGRKLRERLRERQSGSLGQARWAQRPLIKHAFPVWTAPRFSESELESSPSD
jgi:hypothetical protein